MPGVFISYRRDDSGGYAGALVRELNSRLGPDQIFMDIEDIVGGTDFPEVIKEAVQSCDVLLALISSRWLDARDAEGNRRLDDTADYVRQEIVLAMQNQTRVIPVLMEGAQMPSADQLPLDLQTLATRNAVELSNSHWDEDVVRLTDQIKEGLYALGVEKASGAKLPLDFFPIPPITEWVKRFVVVALGCGIGFGAIGVWIGLQQAGFAARSLRAEAEVIRMLQENSNNGGYIYRPEMEYLTANAQVIRFTSGTASNPPAYQVGDRVQVLYDANRPERAVIDSLMERWFITLIFAGFGASGLLLGLMPLAVRGLRRLHLRRLLENGRPIITSFHSVVEKSHITVQGRHPWCLVTEWRNPVSKEMVHFRSHQVWEDPTEKARNRIITVVVDPDNFRRYAMDVSFLKEKPGPEPRTL